MNELVIADYGNVGYHYNLPQRGVEEVRAVVGEVLAGDAVPLMVGGTHIQMYGILMALADKYGPGEVVMVHVDGHYDAYKSLWEMYNHNGSMIRLGVEKGVIKGEDIIQVGLRGNPPPDGDLEWMREHKLRYHFMAEVERNGWDAVLKRVFDEVKGRKVYLSFDLDGIDPAYMPAVATQSIDGQTTSQAAQLIRGLAMQNEMVAVEFSEYNSLMDDRHMTSGVTVVARAQNSAIRDGLDAADLM